MAHFLCFLFFYLYQKVFKNIYLAKTSPCNVLDLIELIMIMRTNDIAIRPHWSQRRRTIATHSRTEQLVKSLLILIPHPFELVHGVTLVDQLHLEQFVANQIVNAGGFLAILLVCHAQVFDQRLDQNTNWCRDFDGFVYDANGILLGGAFRG